jgi:hypothetical protein
MIATTINAIIIKEKRRFTHTKAPFLFLVFQLKTTCHVPMKTFTCLLAAQLIN